MLTNQIKPSYIDCSGLVLSSFSTAAATHTHTQTHTHPGWRAAQPSLSLCCAQRAGRRGAERTAFFGTSRHTKRAGILWITVKRYLKCTTEHPHGSWICISSRFLLEIDKYFGESTVDDLSSALSLSDLESNERCCGLTKIHCVLSRSPNNCRQNFGEVK